MDFFILTRGRSKFFLVNKTKALLVPFLFFYFLGVLLFSIFLYVDSGQIYSFSKLSSFFYLLPISGDIQNPLGVGAIWYLLSLYEIF